MPVLAIGVVAAGGLIAFGALLIAFVSRRPSRGAGTWAAGSAGYVGGADGADSGGSGGSDGGASCGGGSSCGGGGGGGCGGGGGS